MVRIKIQKFLMTLEMKSLCLCVNYLDVVAYNLLFITIFICYPKPV